jgi:O-antigen ligase
LPRWDLLLICVSLMALTYVWRFQAVFPVLGLLQLTSLASLGAYVFYFLDEDRRRSIVHLNNPVVILMASIFVMMFLSLPFSLWPGGSFAFMRHFTKTFVWALLIVACVRAFVDVERLAAVQVVGAAVYAAMVLWQGQVGADLRARGFGGYDPNDYSLFLVCTIPLAVYFLARARTTQRRAVVAVAIALMALAVAKGGSRAGFVGFVAVFSYMLLAYRALPKRIRIGSVVVGFLALALLASDEYWARMSTLLNPKDDYNWSGRSYSGRMEIWKRGVGYMWQHPVLGVGIKQFGTAEGRLSDRGQGPDYGGGLKWSSPHNSFVQVGAELGMTGLVLFLALLGITFRMLLRLARSPPPRSGGTAPQAALAQALIAALFGYVVVGFFLSQAYSAFLYSLFGTVAALAKVASFGATQLPATRFHPVRRRRKLSALTPSLVRSLAGDRRWS